MIEKDACIRIEVYNTALEIPDSQLSKLWDSFYKLDESRARDAGGHGLGLSIVKAIQVADGMGYGVRNDAEGLVFWMDIRKMVLVQKI
jgi:two-component system, OmpR family, sensor histidine kinase VanS